MITPLNAMTELAVAFRRTSESRCLVRTGGARNRLITPELTPERPFKRSVGGYGTPRYRRRI